jgi:hypothetical protein
MLMQFEKTHMNDRSCICMLEVYQFCLFLQVWYWILEIFGQCFFSFYFMTSFHCFIVQKYLCSWISIKFILLQCWTIQYRVMSIWSKSHLSLAPQCRCVGDLKKTHYGSYASDPMSWISNDIINTGCDRHLFRLIGLLTANKSVQC